MAVRFAWAMPAAALMCATPNAVVQGQSTAAPVGWAHRSIAPASPVKRVLVLYDMEGLSGIDRFEMTACRYDGEYARGRDHLVHDVNAVIEGLLEAGAEEIAVVDRHGSGCDESHDLPEARLHPRARPVPMAEASATLDEVWHGVALVGMHAAPGEEGFLEHTGSFGYQRIVNGVSIMEAEQWGIRLGNRGVPIIFASGDDRTKTAFAERLPWVTFVEVKRATSRSSAELRPTGDVRDSLRLGAREAMERRDSTQALGLLPPFKGEFRPVYPETLEPLRAIPGLEFEDGGIRVSGASPREVGEALTRIQTLVAQFWYAEMFWEAAKANPQLIEMADSVFMARWKTGPSDAPRNR